MHKVNSPRSGSMAHWPRVRCKDTVPRAKIKPINKTAEDRTESCILATKVGMCKIYTPEKVIAGTILELPTIKILNYFNYCMTEKGLQKRGIITQCGVEDAINRSEIVSAEISYDFSDSGCSRNKPIIRQIPVSAVVDTANLIDQLISADSFDIRGISKGHGFTGIIERFGIKLKKRKHTRANKTRHIGAISTRGLARIPYTAPQPGNHGHFCRLERNHENVTSSLALDSADNPVIFKSYGSVSGKYLVIAGSVIGPRKSICMVYRRI